MIQYCGINHDHLDYMIDDAPAKAGFYTPKSHFEIFPSSILDRGNPPDYLLIFAWSFFDEIREKEREISGQRRPDDPSSARGFDFSAARAVIRRSRMTVQQDQHGTRK